MKIIKKIIFISASLMLILGASNFAQKIDNAKAEEPVTYERIEHLHCNGLAWFDTGFKIQDENFRIEIVASCSDTSDTSKILFSLNNKTENNFWIGSKSGNWVAGDKTGENITEVSSEKKALIVYTRTSGKNKITVNGNYSVETKTAGSTDFSGQNDNCFLLNGDSSPNYAFKGDIYSFKYFHKGVLKSHLVPAKSSENDFGLYDLASVNSTSFLTNAKTDGMIWDAALTLGNINELQLYKTVEYISSTDGGKQTINTGLSLIDDGQNVYKLDVKAKCTDTKTDTSNVLIALNGSASTGQWAGARDSYWILDTEDDSAKTNISAQEVTQLSVTRENKTTSLKIGDISISCNGTNDYPKKELNENGETHLFGEAGASKHPFVGNLYSCKIYQNGTLVRDYIPMLEISSGIYGLFDLVTKEFNAGSFNFSGGATVYKTEANLNFSYRYNQEDKTYSFNNGINMTTQWNVPVTIATTDDYTIKLGYVTTGNNTEKCVDIDKTTGTTDGDNHVYQFSFKQIPPTDREILIKVTIYIYLNSNQLLYTLKLNDGNGYSVKSMAEKYVTLYDNGNGDTSYATHIGVLTYLAS